jgi:hypothetical protein
VKLVPGKAWRQKKLQYYASRRDSLIHPMKRFACEPTSSRNADADLRWPGTQNPIGWKRKDSCYQRPVIADFRTSNREPSWLIKMENALVDLAQALRERLAVIRDGQSRRDEAKHVARLKAISERIDDLQTRLPKPIDPQLAHYLQRKSYDKALEYLEGWITANTAPQ